MKDLVDRTVAAAVLYSFSYEGELDVKKRCDGGINDI